MDRKNKYRIRSLGDIIRYRRGDMTSEERNSFERDLQKDPFTEEAEEGFSLISDQEAEKELAALKKRLDRRTANRSAKISYRIAASLAILVAISVIFFNRTNVQEPSISKNKTEDTVKPDAIAATEPVMDKSEKTEVPAKGPEGKRSEPMIPSGNKNLAVSTDIRAAKEAPAAEAEQKSADAATEEKIVMADIRQEADSEMRKEKQIIPETVDDEMAKKSGAGNNAELSRVSGVAAPMAVKSSLKTDHSSPQPVTGIDSFNIYIEKKIINPHPDSDREMIVTIAFTVRTDSTLANFRIIDSPGKEYSAEAKRVLREGPLWEPAIKGGKPVNEEYQLTIRFR